MDMKGVGQRIRQLRRHSELTQRELAARMGVSHATIAHWEVGDMMIGDQSLRKLANFFGVSSEWLKTGTGERGNVGSLATEWPGEKIQTIWGIMAELPPEWPPQFQQYVSLSVLFGLEPRAETFHQMVKAAQGLGTNAPLPLSLSSVDSPRRRSLVDRILMSSDAVLDAVEDAIRRQKG